MNDFKPGDKVRVTYEATWDYPNAFNDYTDPFPEGATVELIERADNPANDLVGTVREHKYDTGVMVKTGGGWRLVGNGWNGDTTWDDTDCSLSKVIGAVPGTPAAEAQRPLWTGDGSEEPPAHVKKVRDKEGDIAVREGDAWRWDWHDADCARAWPLLSATFGPFTEVRG
jgi:hypothetical protein